MISGMQIAKYYDYYINTLRFHSRNIRFPLLDDKSEPIHVIANGPTFNDTCKYVSEIPGKTVMCNFALNNFNLFVPDFYILADPVFICMDPDYRGKYYDYIKENNNDDVLIRMSELREKLLLIDKEMVIICPPFLNLEHAICNPKISWEYVNTDIYFPIDDKRALNKWKKNRVAPQIQSVVVLEIYVALQLGYKTIYLHGCEQSCVFGGALRIDQDSNTLMFENSHFYEKPSQRTWNDDNMLVELRAQERLFTSLYELRDYSKALNARIINMSKNSWVDCFERFNENN